MFNFHYHLNAFWIWLEELPLVFYLTFNLLGLESLSFANQLGNIVAGSCLIILAPFLTSLWSCGFKTDKWNVVLWYRIKWGNHLRAWNNGLDWQAGQKGNGRNTPLIWLKQAHSLVCQIVEAASHIVCKQAISAVRFSLLFIFIIISYLPRLLVQIS